VVSWQERGGAIAPPKFQAVGKLSENFVLVGNISSKSAIFRAKNPHFGGK